MRIISGSYKGKKIAQPKDIKTRPLKDLTKESIFNIINHSNKFKINLSDCDILDLFSGVGSFGIECLSRGVKSVVFIENYHGVLPILEKNLSLLNSNNYKIIKDDVYSKYIFDQFKEKFDIIFLDPPYKDIKFKNILSRIKEQKMLNKNGIIILHRHKNEENDFSQSFKILEEKRYGISKIIFITYLH